MIKFPRTLGEAADMLYDLQQKRLAKTKEVTELKEQEDALSSHILDNMLPAANLDRAGGKVGQVSIKDDDWAEIEDWAKYLQYVAKTKNYELIQKRPGITALREIWETKKVVPGVVHKHGKKLHVSKIGGGKKNV